MAYYKLFPTQDTTIYSTYPNLNSGLDAICEISNIQLPSSKPGVARSLILFDTAEINDIINNNILNRTYSVFLKNSVATVQGMNSNTYLETRPIAQDWDNGTGRYADIPQTQDGASWITSDSNQSVSWSFSGNISGYNYTSSFSTYYSASGGGNWFSTSSLVATQSFGLRTVKDISMDVTPIVKSWYSGSIPNHGLITKLPDAIEFDPSQNTQPSFKFYSVDTNTIYPPCLEFRWNDYSTILTGSASASIVIDPIVKATLTENREVFHNSSVNRFRLNVSPLYPTRQFQTSSLYTSLKYLPTSSFYALKDLSTNEYIIDFDPTYTKISSDIKGNYFDIYMSGLEPERYYCILIKTTIDGSTIILDNDYYFKVING
jgi:hypothetical protein